MLFGHEYSGVLRVDVDERESGARSGLAVGWALF